MKSGAGDTARRNMEGLVMQYIVSRSGKQSNLFHFRGENEAAVARVLEASGAPAVFEVTGVLVSGDTMPAVNGKRWLENYRLDQLRRAALDNTAPDDDAPIYTCAEPPAWHDDASAVAQVFRYLQSDPNCPLSAYAKIQTLTMAISGIVRYQNLEKETTDFQTVSNYVWALIRSKRTG